MFYLRMVYSTEVMGSHAALTREIKADQPDDRAKSNLDLEKTVHPSWKVFIEGSIPKVPLSDPEGQWLFRVRVLTKASIDY